MRRAISRGICWSSVVEVEDAGDLTAEIEQRGDEIVILRAGGLRRIRRRASDVDPWLTAVTILY